jgi:hypothetical protein
MYTRTIIKRLIFLDCKIGNIDKIKWRKWKENHPKEAEDTFTETEEDHKLIMKPINKTITAQTTKTIRR